MVLPTSTLDSLTAPDLVLVPGSGNPMPALGDRALLAWVRHMSQHATWMASTCTGASIYAAAGLLAGRRATTHWAFRDVLASMGVNVCLDRVVFDEPFVSGAGVSAGIDMALALTGRVHGPAVAEAIQLVAGAPLLAAGPLTRRVWLGQVVAVSSGSRTLSTIPVSTSSGTGAPCMRK